jgi:dihydroorotase
MRKLSIIRPDDWHVHLRDQLYLQDTVNATAKHFSRALAMPNLIPPLTTVEDILAYRKRILAVAIYEFNPYMTFYLNESVTAESLIEAKKYPFILGAKLYPAGVTTNSQDGVASIQALFPLFAVMEKNSLVLQIHGEDPDCDIFEREEVFLQNTLPTIITAFPKLRIVLEHISTKEAVNFIKAAPAHVSATITPQHLLYTRNDLLSGGIKPHYYCLPILKQEADKQALREVVISGNPKFFAGTDSAPHSVDNKQSACGCAGIYSAPFAVSMYAQVFHELDCIDKLEPFLSFFGAEFYQLPRNTTKITLIEKKSYIPNTLSLGKDTVIPIGAGSLVDWSIDGLL